MGTNFNIVAAAVLLFSVSTIYSSPTHHVAKRETCLRLYARTGDCNNHGKCKPGFRAEYTGHVLCDCDEDLWSGEFCDYLMTKSCSDNPCSRGTCESGPNGSGFTCINCDDGYTGIYCDVPTLSICERRNPCTKVMMDPSVESGSLMRKVQTGICRPGLTNDDYTCECFSKMAGVTCNTILKCEDQQEPCKNGGTCTNTGGMANYWQCTCPQGFEGEACGSAVVIASACSSGPCSNSGTCREDLANGGYRCICTAQYTGNRCERLRDNPCSTNPCRNGGTCTPQGTGFFCTCPPGRAGPQCTLAANACASNPCRNSGTCTDIPGGFRCECMTEFTGARCENMNMPDHCNPNPCGGGTCMLGSDGDSFICMQDPCLPNPCNSGTCERLSATTFSCDCPPGLTGTVCTETDIPVGVCASYPCMNSGTCNPYNSGRDFYCSCPSGFTGERCTVISNACDNSPCQNGGFCNSDNHDNGNSYTCLCREGYTGINCQTPTFAACSQNPCRNGHCFNAYTSTGYMCNCQYGYIGTNCERRDPCASSPCGSDTCVTRSDGNSFTCLCSCTTGPQTPCSRNPCLNGATCSNTGTSYICSCRQNYQGRNCGTYTPPEPCFSNPCRSGGTCQSVFGNAYQCTCPINYIGANCETFAPTNMCATSPCRNGGSCNNRGSNSFTCTCSFGFSGSTCEIATCQSNYCRNGGTCVNSSPSTLECTCPPGFSGMNCGIPTTVDDPCRQSPCQNGGTCSFNMAGDIFCMCPAGYTGQRCQSTPPKGDCQNNACRNGATCITATRPGMPYACLCTRDWKGSYCHIPASPGGDPPTGPGTECPNHAVDEVGCLYLYAITDVCNHKGSCHKEVGNRDAYCCCDEGYKQEGIGCVLQ